MRGYNQLDSNRQQLVGCVKLRKVKFDSAASPRVYVPSFAFVAIFDS